MSTPPKAPPAPQYTNRSAFAATPVQLAKARRQGTTPTPQRRRAKPDPLSPDSLSGDAPRLAASVLSPLRMADPLDVATTSPPALASSALRGGHASVPDVLSVGSVSHIGAFNHDAESTVVRALHKLRGPEQWCPFAEQPAATRGSASPARSSDKDSNDSSMDLSAGSTSVPPSPGTSQLLRRAPSVSFLPALDDSAASPSPVATSNAPVSPRRRHGAIVGGMHRRRGRGDAAADAASRHTNAPTRSFTPFAHMAKQAANMSDVGAKMDAFLTKFDAATAERKAAESRTENVRRMIRSIMMCQRPTYKKSESHAAAGAAAVKAGLAVSRLGRHANKQHGGEGDSLSASMHPGASQRAQRPSSAHTNTAGQPFTPRKRAWLRAMFKWAVSREIDRLRKEKMNVVNDARQHLDEQRRQAERAQMERLQVERQQTCVALFGDIAVKIKTGKYRTQVLTEAKYAELKQQVAIVAGTRREANPVLCLADINKLMEGTGQRFDAATFKKLDRDHSGYLELHELVHGFYPSATQREIATIRNKVEEEAQRAQGAGVTKTVTALPPDVKAQVEAMFARCDRGRKGVLVKGDLEAMIPDPEWRANLGVDTWLPDSTSCLTFNEFMELIKFAFPPFNGDRDRATSNAAKASNVRRGLPLEVLQAQSVATSSVD